MLEGDQFDKPVTELKILGYSFIHGDTNCINFICYHSHFYSVELEVQQYRRSACG